MIKIISACTNEIDVPETAVDEILAELDLEKNLMKNSVAYISCFSEFIESGSLKAVTDALPCDCLAVTTQYNMANGVLGDMMMIVSLITSDTVEFSTAFTAPLTEETRDASIVAAYKDAESKLSGKPELAFVCAPLINNIGGDAMLRSFDGVSGGVPVFGTVALDHTHDYSATNVIYNSEVARDRLGFILMSGDIKPRFYVANMLEGRITRLNARITKSVGNVLYEINNESAIEFMKPFGMLDEQGNVIDGANITPFCISSDKGEPPIVRAVYATAPDGGMVCGGDMPEGSNLWIGSLDFDDVISTTTDVIKKIVDDGNLNGLFIYSCKGRNMAMGTRVYAEMEAVDGVLSTCGVDYHFAHSGGELCPVYDAEGKISNRLHNFTLIACAF
jgi:hypothetical protein